MRDDDFAALTADHRRRQAELADTAAELRRAVEALDPGIEQCMATLAAAGSNQVASCPDCERPYWSDAPHDCPTPGGEPPDSPPAGGRILTPAEARRVGAPVARYLGPALLVLGLIGCAFTDPNRCDLMRCPDETVCVEGEGCVPIGRGADGYLHQFTGEHSRCGDARQGEAAPDDHDSRGRCPRCWTAR